MEDVCIRACFFETTCTIFFYLEKSGRTHSISDRGVFGVLDNIMQIMKDNNEADAIAYGWRVLGGDTSSVVNICCRFE